MSNLIGWFFGCLSMAAMIAVFVTAAISLRRDQLRQRLTYRAKRFK